MPRARWDRVGDVVPELANGFPDEEYVGRKLDENPEVVLRVIVDVYDSIKREEERAAGQVKMGRRPKPDFVPLEQMMREIIPPKFTARPFPEALTALLNGRSQRQFAAKVPCSQPSLSRFLAGKQTPDRAMLEAIAAAAGVPPYYFAEWRALYLGDLVRTVYGDDPRRSIGMLKAIINRIEVGREKGHLTKTVGPW